MTKIKLEKGDVVQLDPETTKTAAFRGCFMVVSEPKDFGAQGYVQALGESRDTMGLQAYYRACWDEMEFVGKAIWEVE